MLTLLSKQEHTMKEKERKKENKNKIKNKHTQREGRQKKNKRKKKRVHVQIFHWKTTCGDRIPVHLSQQDSSSFIVGQWVISVCLHFLIEISQSQLAHHLPSIFPSLKRGSHQIEPATVLSYVFRLPLSKMAPDQSFSSTATVRPLHSLPVIAVLHNHHPLNSISATPLHCHISPQILPESPAISVTMTMHPQVQTSHQ